MGVIIMGVWMEEEMAFPFAGLATEPEPRAC